MAELGLSDAYTTWADDLTRYATALVGPADANDVVADVFVTLVARGDRAWAAVQQPREYLYRSVTNSARMQTRTARRRTNRELRWTLPAPPGELLADPQVRSALDKLSVQQRAAIFLTYWHDLSPHTIAEMLGISEGSVKRHLARARATLREVLT